MDIMKLFEEYLPKWSEEKMQPIPTAEHPDRWAVAWTDFQKEFLPTIKDELIADYKNMQLKTYGDLKKKKKKIVKSEDVEPIPEKQEEKELSEWEKVQRFLNSSK